MFIFTIAKSLRIAIVFFVGVQCSLLSARAPHKIARAAAQSGRSVNARHMSALAQARASQNEVESALPMQLQDALHAKEQELATAREEKKSTLKIAALQGVITAFFSIAGLYLNPDLFKPMVYAALITFYPTLAAMKNDRDRFAALEKEIHALNQKIAQEQKQK